MSQRPIPLVRKGAANLSTIAKTIMLPHDFPPSRVPTFPNIERTAVVSLESNTTVISTVYDQPTRRFVLLREPAAPLWIDDKLANSSVGSAVLSYQYSDVATGTNVLDPPLFAVGARTPVGTVDEVDTWLYAPVDPSTGTHVLSAFLNSNAAVSYDIEYITESGKRFTATDLQANNTQRQSVIFEKSLSQSVWFRVTRIAHNTGADTRLCFAIDPGQRALLPHVVSLESEASVEPYRSSRVTALSCLLSNVSRVQMKQGTVRAARLSADRVAFWSVVQSDLDRVHPSSRYFGALENGLYFIAPPTQESEVFRPCTLPFPLITSAAPGNVTVFGTIQAPVVLPDSDDPFLVAVTEEEATVDEAIIAVTLDMHLEFRTSSPLFQIGVAAVPLEQYHAAQLVVAQAGYMYENPTHWADLARKIVSLAGIVIPTLFPGSNVARVATAASYLLPRIAPRRDFTQKQMVKPNQQRRRQQPRRKKVRVVVRSTRRRMMKRK